MCVLHLSNATTARGDNFLAVSSLYSLSHYCLVHRKKPKPCLFSRFLSRAAVTLGIVMGVFVICWLPFFIWMPVHSLFELTTPRLLYDFVLWVGYGNSAINPFIYGFFCKEFRQVMKAHRVKIYNSVSCCK